MTYGDGFHSYKGSWIDDLERRLITSRRRSTDSSSESRSAATSTNCRQSATRSSTSTVGISIRGSTSSSTTLTRPAWRSTSTPRTTSSRSKTGTTRSSSARCASSASSSSTTACSTTPKTSSSSTLRRHAAPRGDVQHVGARSRVTEHWQDEADERREMFEAARDWDPSPALGEPPETVTDPLMQMLWGITTEKVNNWLDLDSENGESDQLDGFGSSSGQVKGRARVVTDSKDVINFQEDEIFVAPLTDPTWAPVFPRTKGAITDVGGKAITCGGFQQSPFRSPTAEFALLLSIIG